VVSATHSGERLGARHRVGGEDRDAERPADVERAVDESGRQAGFFVGDSGQGGDLRGD
jgi:hypothetical protein